MRLFVLPGFFLFVSFFVSGQSCDCPAVTSCGTCAGGLISITLRYTGASPQTITAADQISTVFSGVVNPNNTFSFVGSIPNDKFVGTSINLTVGGLANATIPSNCGVVFVGNTYGSFVIVEAASKSGGPLCCSAGAIETNPPQIGGCPANFTIDLSSSACTAPGGWAVPTAADDCSVVSFSGTHNPTDQFSIGVTDVTYTAVDKFGNTATCLFNVTVVDNSAPVISDCPADITIEAADECQSTVSWDSPIANDNCSATLSSSHEPGSIFSLGTTVVTYTATDPSGNTATCSFNVIVRDTTSPVFSNCPSDIILEATGCQPTVSWTVPTIIDNCTATLVSSHASGSVFSLGNTVVTYTATDGADNVSRCTFNVIVRDTSSPVFTGCPADLTIATAGCEAAVSWVPPTASDNCIASLTSSHQPGATFPLGTTRITYTATDVAGNRSTCSFTLTVRTDAAPAVTGCPEDITLYTFEGNAPATWTAPQATPVCGALTTNASHLPGTQFNIGVTGVAYEFQDGTGNKSSCTFDVTVVHDDLTFEVSKVITPNGDGINDTWLVSNIEKFKENTVVVVDRWGNRIYQISGYDNAQVQWGGIGPGGGRVPVGTYFYTIEVRANGQIVRDSGFVEVIY